MPAVGTFAQVEIERSPIERVLARALTGPLAFALAGGIDVLALLLALARERGRRRYHALRDAR